MNHSIVLIILSLLLYKVNRIKGIDISGPRCIPLTSKNIEANPYHPALLSIPGKHIRNGFGLPTLTGMGAEVPSTKCPKGVICMKTVVNSYTTVISKGYSISLSKTKSNSISFSNTGSSGSSNSYSKSMGKTLDEAITKSLTFTDEASYSKQLSESISNVHGKSSGYTETLTDVKTNENTSKKDVKISGETSNIEKSGNTVSENKIDSSSSGGSNSVTTGSSSSQESCHKMTHTVGVSVGLIAAPVKASVGVSRSLGTCKGTNQKEHEAVETNWNSQQSQSVGSSKTREYSHGSSKTSSITNGVANAQTKSFSSSSAEENRESDSIYVSKQAATSDSKSSSKSNHFSTRDAESYKVDETFQSSKDNKIENTEENRKFESEDLSESYQNSTSHTYSFSIDETFEIPQSSCKMAVCLPFVKAIPIPFECIRDATIREKGILNK